MLWKEIAQAEAAREALDERIQRLFEDLRATEDAIRRAEAELNQLTGYIEALEKISQLQNSSNENEGGKPTPAKRVANPDRSSVAEEAIRLIVQEGRPLTRAELYDRLQRGGMHISGKDPPMVLSTMLWRERERVARIRGHGYWPADMPYPPADYFPKGQATLI